MERLVYCNLSGNGLSESLDSNGAEITWDDLTQSETIVLDVRFMEKTGSNTFTEVFRTVKSARFGIGNVNAGADFGQWGIKLGDGAEVEGGNAIEPVDFDIGAAALQAELEGLTDIATFGAPTIREEDGSWLITFAGAAAEVPIHVTHNSLAPTSRVRIRAHELDGVWIHEVRLIQEKAAFTSQISYKQAEPPLITRFQGGSTVDGVAVNEIQKIQFNSAFRGLYKIKRGLISTAFLDEADGPSELQTALEALADEDSAFVVTRPTSQVGHIEFTGEMAGQGHDLLEITEVTSPAPDIRLRLNLNNQTCAELLRSSEVVDDKVTFPLELEIVYEDPTDDTQDLTWVYQTKVAIRRELIYELEAELDETNHLRPIDPTGHIPFDVSQVANGQLFYPFAIGDGTKIEWLIDHQLHTKNIGVDLKENAAGGKFLNRGTDYEVAYDTDGPGEDAIIITLLGAYAANPPAAGELFGEVVGRQQTSFFDPHGHPMAQIEGLLATLAAMQAEIDELKVLGLKDFALSADEGGYNAAWNLPLFSDFKKQKGFIAPPFTGRSVTFAYPESNHIGDIDTTTLPRRARALLPAVHDAAVEALGSTGSASQKLSHAPDISFAGRVFENQTAGSIYLIGGAGIKGKSLPPGRFAACDGRAWYEVVQYADDESSYYPADFEVHLWQDSISDSQLRAGGKLDCQYQLSLQTHRANVEWQWKHVIEVGLRTADVGPGNVGTNFDDIVWEALPLQSEQIIVTPTLRTHDFGLRIYRGKDDTLKAWGRAYGSYTIAEPPPGTSVELRGRLICPDTKDTVADPVGFLAYSGPRIPEETNQKVGVFEVTS